MGKETHDSLSNLESKNPGTLNAFSGSRSAAIGGGPLENSGYITFNGGNVNATADGRVGNGSGAAIGGGHAGGAYYLVFNGGIVHAISSYHGAAIGGGCTYGGGMSNQCYTYPMRDALISRATLKTIAGDITINGGYVRAEGATHGNAFGQGCGSNNDGKTILITGGTLLPSSYSGMYDIGGSDGNVIITGGSVGGVEPDGSAKNSVSFQGNDNDGLAYGAVLPDGSPDRTNKVGLISVDVTPKIKAMAKKRRP